MRSLFELRHPSFPVLRLALPVLGLFWALYYQPPDFQAFEFALNYITGLPDSLAGKWQSFGQTP